MNLQEARLFVARFEKGGNAPEEHAAFLQWVRSCSTSDLAEVASEHESLVDQWSLSVDGPSSSWVEGLEVKLDRTEEKLEEVPVRRLPAERTGRRFPWMAAASVLVLLTAGAYWWNAQRSDSQTDMQKKSILVLSNTVSTSRGEQQQVVLPDGSKVWLNASSTLHYPVSFTGKDRTVELTGEAFFEVAKSAVAPFRVKVRDMQIQVLGTHFNVMGYPDEPVSRTTLVEGAVKITREGEEILLGPGEQAETAYPASGDRSPITLIRGVDPDAVLAWKNGSLEFNNDDLQTVMRKLSRAYDVDIHYDGVIPERHFGGSFEQKKGLDPILKTLELQKIHFNYKIKEKTIIVTQ